MRDPHQLSSAYILDPAYSTSERLPAAPGSSLHGGSSSEARWFYAVGDVAAYLMAESRKRSFRLVHHVAHPGFFRPHHACVYFSSTFNVENNAEAAFPFSFYHAGELRLLINGRFVGHWPATKRPILRSADLRQFLVPGENQIKVIVCSSGTPVCLSPLSAMMDWRCSIDDQSWEEPESFSFTTDSIFPHDERLPSVAVSARKQIGALYDFGVELIGTLGLAQAGPPAFLRFKPGESTTEAENPSDEFDEQPVLEIDRSTNPDATSEEAAFRFVRLIEGPSPDPADLQCHLTLHPAAYRGAFACSDPIATRIWMHSAYTLRLCLRDSTVDGLKRDRLPWVGDLYLSLRCNACSFAEHDIFLQTLLAFYHENSDQHDFSGIFDYTLFWVIAAGEYFLYSGDGTGARFLWPRVRRVLENLNRLRASGGLLGSEQAKWIFLDWADLPKNGNLLVIQSLFIQALDAAALLAVAVGENDTAAGLKQDAVRLRSLTGAAFWNPQTGFYDDSSKMPAGACGSRHANAFAVLGGISDSARVRDALEKARHHPGAAASTTPYMRYFECAAVCRALGADEMRAEVIRYWGGMLSAGATTFWEAYDEKHTGAEHFAFYDRPFGKSLCHAWSAGPMALYSMDLFDLHPIEPAWKKFTFSPRATGLAWACARIPTPSGDLAAEFEGDAAQLEIPAGCAWVDPASKTMIAAGGKPRKITLHRDGIRWMRAGD